jgi:hypothetical protein
LRVDPRAHRRPAVGGRGRVAWRWYLVRNGEKAVAFTWFRLCRMQRNHWESQRALPAQTRKRGGRHSNLGREAYGPWCGPVSAET